MNRNQSPQNRVLMGSMHTGLEGGLLKPAGLQEMAAFFAARAEGGVGLMVTGGVAPNREGRVSPFASKLTYRWEAWRHRVVTDAVHAHDGKIAMQILHAGRYAYHPFAVAPSPGKSPISMFKPRTLSENNVRGTSLFFLTFRVVSFGSSLSVFFFFLSMQCFFRFMNFSPVFAPFVPT